MRHLQRVTVALLSVILGVVGLWAGVTYGAATSVGVDRSGTT